MLSVIGFFLGIIVGQIVIDRIGIDVGFWSFTLQALFLMAFASVAAAISEGRK